MIEENIEIATPDGTVDGYLYTPDRSARPAILHLTDIGGIRPVKQEMARRLAGEGYCVLQPNVFYRTGRPPLFDHKPNFAEERTIKRFAELTKPLTPEAVARDAESYLRYLRSRQEVSTSGIGIVGYCFTGAVALRIAAARPDDVRAVASFHGGGLYTDAPTSPHLVLPRIRARLYFAHAVQDRTMPEGAIEALDHALAAWGGTYESEVYEGALHGFTVPGSAVYAEPQAERAYAKLRELFAETL